MGAGAANANAVHRVGGPRIDRCGRWDAVRLGALEYSRTGTLGGGSTGFDPHPWLQGVRRLPERNLPTGAFPAVLATRARAAKSPSCAISSVRTTAMSASAIRCSATSPAPSRTACRVFSSRSAGACTRASKRTATAAHCQPQTRLHDLLGQGNVDAGLFERRKQLAAQANSPAALGSSCMADQGVFTAETQSAQRDQSTSPASEPLPTVAAARRRSPLAGDPAGNASESDASAAPFPGERL